MLFVGVELGIGWVGVGMELGAGKWLVIWMCSGSFLLDLAKRGFCSIFAGKKIWHE